jgi:hypothetical protein
VVANLTTTDPIDLSSNQYVSLEFQQYYRRYFDSTFVFVSNDNVNWVKFPVNVSLNNSGYTASNPITSRINISNVAGNQSTVWIRFQYYSPSTLHPQAGCGYAWMIDDVEITVTPQYDVELIKVYHGDIINSYQYSIVTPQQVESVVLGATVNNLGYAQNSFNVNYDIKLNGVSVNAGQFNVYQSAPNEEVTLWHQTAFTPTEFGDYTVEFTVVSSSGEDTSPDNNVRQSQFTLSPYIYGAVGPIEITINRSAPSAPSTTPVIYEMGNTYIMQETAILTAVVVAFGPGTEASNAQRDVEAKVTIYEYDFMNGEISSELTEPVFYAIQAADVNTGNNANYTTIILETEIALEASKAYIVTVGNAEATALTLQGSRGDDDNGVFLKGPFGASGDVSWFADNNKPAINLNFNPNITSVSNVKSEITNINVYPNPAIDLVRIGISLDKNTNVIINLFDINGKVIITENLRNRSGIFEHNISTSNLSDGIYTLQIITDNGVSTKKVIIAK